MDTQFTSPTVMLNSMMTRVASVIDHHRIPSGGPADLANLLKSLQRNKHLAMDFWMVVDRMSRDRGQASGPDAGPIPTWGALNACILQDLTLEAIVQVMTGLEVFRMMDEGGEARQAVLHMKNLLAGKDIHFDTVVGDNAITVTTHAIETPRVAPSSQGEAYKEALRARLDQMRLESQEKAAGLVPANCAVADEIDPAAATGPDVAAASIPDQATPPAPDKGDDELRRLLFGSAYTDPPRSAMRPARFRVPLELRMCLRVWEPALPRPKRSPRRKALMLGSSLLLLAGCVVLFRAQRNGSLELYGARIYSAGQRRMVDAIDRLDDAYGGDAVADGAATSDSHSAEATASSSLATRRTGSSRLKLASMVKDSKTQSVEQEDSALAGEPGRPVQSKPNPAEAAATSGNFNAGRPVAVSADVMKAGLISSPAVEYPAGTSQLDGHVVLQVLISKSGYVKTLQVVEGDPALRSAAIQTVSAWRYRPYLVNGEPVEVSTTVTLYFKLDY